MTFYDVEHRDGFCIYTQHSIGLYTKVRWCIPEELYNNKIIQQSMNFKLFDELDSYIRSIEAYNFQLSKLYLDIERQPVEKKKQEVKEKCYPIIERININLSPYHWEMEKFLNVGEGYLIGLFTGENQMLKRIQDM